MIECPRLRPGKGGSKQAFKAEWLVKRLVAAHEAVPGTPQVRVLCFWVPETGQHIKVSDAAKAPARFLGFQYFLWLPHSPSKLQVVVFFCFTT
jgi:hypothetical protein